MRYLKYTLLLLLLPSVCFGFGVGTVGSLGSTNETIAGGGCSDTPYSTAITTSSSIAVGSNTDTYFVGIVSDSGSSSHTVCRADFYIRGIAGDIGGKTLEVRVYDSTSSLKATSTSISGASITSSTWTTFTFPIPVVVNATDRVVVTMNGVDNANYASLAYVTSDIDSSYSHYARFTSTMAVSSDFPTHDISYKIYEVNP